MNPIDLAWLAGLLEGDGCFHLNSDANSISIRLEMRDRDVVARAARLLKSNRPKRHDHPLTKGPMWFTYLYGEPSVTMMKQLLPLMGKRRSKRIRSAIKNYRVSKGIAYINKHAARPDASRRMKKFWQTHRAVMRARIKKGWIKRRQRSYA